MSITASLRRLFSPPSSKPFDPQTYWEDRHQTDQGSLKAVGHRSLSDAQNQAQYEDKVKRISTLIQQFVSEPSGKTLLDAGCGVGALSRAYVDLGLDVVGVDFSNKAVEQARKHVPSARFVVSPLSSLDLNQSFDVVCVIDVLLHVVDEGEWLATLTTLTQHLSPKGVLIILDCLNPGNTQWARHCNPRSFIQYQSALADLGWSVVQHDQFSLQHEGGSKNLIAVQRNQ